ncbi:hypothetical protein G7Y89_g6935 [Cudoniella acicularis]|uniref:Uncharacterized protein n=1 Tax=Cudoniella acicularis TaxID=354080 RepID=A0A8H4RM32_9HELO|nr:hypothetical protein G7Y89_g6935 [Cudoniella acicularis]
MKWLLQPKRKPLLKQGLATCKSDGALGDHRQFDKATGQVFTETTASIQSFHDTDRDWTRQTKVVIGPDYRDSEECGRLHYDWDAGEDEVNLSGFHDYIDGMRNSRVRGFKGARSLQDTAVECILNHISDVTLDGMQCLPVQVVRRIWHAINKRCLLSFNTWMIFSKLLHQVEGSTLSLLRYRQAIQKPTSPLHVYTMPITSKTFDFITSLSITTIFSLPDLVKLSQVTNIGVLEIINTTGMKTRSSSSDKASQPVSDRLIRAWHFAALDENAFKVLRILRLWNHRELTSKSLEYLNSFPALALYDVRGCAFSLDAKIDAKRLGWKPTIEANVLGLLEAACVERAVLMQSSLGIETKPVRKSRACQIPDGAKVRRIPRSEVPSFLTRPEASLPGEALIERESFHRIQANLDIIAQHHPEKAIKDNRWKIMDRHVFSKSRALETWEFTTYTSFARIGELRNDTDLSRAGVDVGDQVLVGNELVNSVPLVSLRLGETPAVLQTSSVNSSHKPFYSSMYEESEISSLKYEQGDSGNNSSTRTLSFIRIKVPPIESSQEAVPSLASKEEVESQVNRAAPVATVKKGPVMRSGSVMRNKRRKIGDLWNSLY